MVLTPKVGFATGRSPFVKCAAISGEIQMILRQSPFHGKGNMKAIARARGNGILLVSRKHEYVMPMN